MDAKTKLYATRDHMAQGQHYLRHVDAMTGEGLHAKSAIAAELAHRDILIERQAAELEALRADAERMTYLESLMIRVEFQNSRRPAEPVQSDMYIGNGRCALYVRDLCGNVVNNRSGSGGSVRAALDAARTGGNNA